MSEWFEEYLKKSPHVILKDSTEFTPATPTVIRKHHGNNQTATKIERKVCRDMSNDCT